MATARHDTTDDLVSMCIGRPVEDGEMLAVTGYLPANLVQVFRVASAPAFGNILCRKGTIPGLIHARELRLDQACFIWGLAAGTCEQQPSSTPRELFLPTEAVSLSASALSRPPRHGRGIHPLPPRLSECPSGTPHWWRMREIVPRIR